VVVLVNVPQPVTNHGIDYLGIAHAESLASLRQKVGCVGHGFHAAGYNHGAIGGRNRLFGKPDGFQSRTANLVDGHCSNFGSQPSNEQIVIPGQCPTAQDRQGRDDDFGRHSPGGQRQLINLNLATMQRPAEARATLLQAQALITRCGMAGALEQVRQLLQALSPAAMLLQRGQRRVLLARRGVPRGRPLRPDELIEVIWSIEVQAQREVGQAATKSTARQEILLRLCAEASAQDAEPTVGDLAEALGVTPRTIDRDIAALRAAGAVLVTRGGGG